MRKKIKVAIELDEIIRAKWLQFDRYYVQEFGEEGILYPDKPYCFDFFNNYKWDDVIEESKELKEPEDIPETINPIDYQVNDETGEIPADFLLFKKSEKNKITAKELFNRFMYQDYLLEINGTAPLMYKNLDVDINKFLVKYDNNVEFILFSVENYFSIPPTLFFLSKTSSRFKNIKFLENPMEIYKHANIVITTNPEILKNKVPWNKKVVKVNRPYNMEYKNNKLEILQIIELMNNKKFEKIIKYKK